MPRFYGSGVQWTQLDSRCWQSFVLFWRLCGENLLPGSSRLLADSVPRGCRSCFLAGQSPGVSLLILLSLAKSATTQVPPTLGKPLTSPSPESLLLKPEKNSLLLRVHVIRLGLPKSPSYFYVQNFNSILKVLLPCSRD